MKDLLHRSDGALFLVKLCRRRDEHPILMKATLFNPGRWSVASSIAALRKAALDFASGVVRRKEVNIRITDTNKILNRTIVRHSTVAVVKIRHIHHV